MPTIHRLRTLIMPAWRVDCLEFLPEHCQRLLDNQKGRGGNTLIPRRPISAEDAERILGLQWGTMARVCYSGDCAILDLIKLDNEPGRHSTWRNIQTQLELRKWSWCWYRRPSLWCWIPRIRPEFIETAGVTQTGYPRLEDVPPGVQYWRNGVRLK